MYYYLFFISLFNFFKKCDSFFTYLSRYPPNRVGSTWSHLKHSSNILIKLCSNKTNPKKQRLSNVNFDLFYCLTHTPYAIKYWINTIFINITGFIPWRPRLEEYLFSTKSYIKSKSIGLSISLNKWSSGTILSIAKSCI